MADSRTELIMKAVVAALRGTGLPAGTTVDRNRILPLSLEDLPRISVFSRDEDVQGATENRHTPLSERNMRIAVVARAIGTDEALDPLNQWIVRVLCAMPAASWFLRGLALQIKETSVDWEFDEDSQASYSVAARMFIIRYSTRRDDLTAQA